MNIKKLLFKSFVACGVLAVILDLLNRTVLTKTDSSRTSYDEIDSYIKRQMDRLHIPGLSLAIVEGDKIGHLRGFGRARPDGEVPSPQTPFLIGSLTKSFTALAVMQLIEAGKIELDAPVRRYLPWFRVADPEASVQITVRHLLNQTSGLSTSSGWIPLADFDNSPDATGRQARTLSALGLAHPAGSVFEYSNSNYNLLGLIIEVASGKSYADYVQTHIFTPLNMHHSFTSQAIARQNGLAVGHQYWFWFPFPVPDLPMPRGSLPSGQLISCAEDMARYMIALLNEGRYGDRQILSSAGIAQLHHGVAEQVEMGISIGNYGMGWYVSETGRTKIVWHTGMVPDFSAYMALLPEQKKGVVMLVNADHFMMNPVLAEVGEGVASLLAGEQPAPMRFGFIPWLMRSLLLIPALQLIDVVITLRLLRGWHQNPDRRPNGVRQWGLYVLPSVILNLVVALTSISILGALRGFWRLFMPDFSWMALVCGSFAGIWTFLRTGLLLRTLRKPQIAKLSVSGPERIR